MRNAKRINFCCCIVMLLFGTTVAAQQRTALPLKYSKERGASIYFANRAITLDNPVNNVVAVRLSRDTGRGFKELVRIERAKTRQQFVQLCGEEIWNELKLQKQFPDDDAAWKFILEHPSLDDYGFLSFNIRFAQAMGCAYLDAEAAGLSTRKQWRYRAEWLSATGQPLQIMEGVVTGTPEVFTFPKPEKLTAFATDSLCEVKWYALHRTDPGTMMFADVYRQEAGKGPFAKRSIRVMGIPRNDSLIFAFQEAVSPNHLYRYYITPTDEAGNAAQHSDTLSVLSVDFASLPLLESVVATDTLNGIRLTWKSLGDTPSLIGVEIQRSRDVRGNYVVLDTVAVDSDMYFDTRVLPAIPYYYRLRPLGLSTMERETGYSGYATASVKNSINPPEPPYGLTASITNGNVHLEWEPVSDTDVYAYFVYRGVAINGSMDVISPGLSATSFSDTTAISGRVQYVYAVKAVNHNSLESDFSNHVTIRQAVRHLPPPPSGISGSADENKAVVVWPSAATKDHTVAGYNVYRRKFYADKTFNLDQSAATQAQALRFTLLNTVLVGSSRYEDLNVEVGEIYEYAIA